MIHVNTKPLSRYETPPKKNDVVSHPDGNNILQSGQIDLFSTIFQFHLSTKKARKNLLRTRRRLRRPRPQFWMLSRRHFFRQQPAPPDSE